MSGRPIGYFVHHQGRGHAERCAAIVNALPADRPVTVFCARPDMLPALRDGVELRKIPSLFEPAGDEAAGLADVEHPENLHCAPVGWPGIRRAMASLANWFEQASPGVMISDVSAEVAQLARLCSVPHVVVLQHGERDDPGHRAAWQGAVGVLAPFHRSLAQSDWPEQLLGRTCFAGGLGVGTPLPDRRLARQRLGLSGNKPVYLVVAGAGGDGMPSAALAVGARTFPEVDWHTIGPVRPTWHATEPSNLNHHGWVDDATSYLAAADLIIGSTGNTLTHQILAAGKPWIAVPQWCYFDEQVCKARTLQAAGVAHHEPHLPSSADHWRRAVTAALESCDPARQRSLVSPRADQVAADWLEQLLRRLWQEDSDRRATAPSVLTIASGREAHLHNLIRGLNLQTLAPAELVIGVMQSSVYQNLPACDFPVRQMRVNGDDLPLSAARNAVARSAASDALIFLDVDCIPAPTLVADYAARIDAGAGLLMGEVRYLPEGATGDGWTPASLDRLAIEHDARAPRPEAPIERCDDYRCFWSLNFAMHREDYDQAGGFDESFTGYGGEDTDFGRTVQELAMPISWLRGACAWHQFHDQRMPPTHHLRSVVRNAQVFEAKWGHRTMDHWLYCFGLMGLIEDSVQGLRIIATEPALEPADPESGPRPPYASTDKAIASLEAQALAQYHDTHGSAAPPGWLDRKRFLYRPMQTRTERVETCS